MQNISNGKLAEENRIFQQRQPKLTRPCQLTVELFISNGTVAKLHSRSRRILNQMGRSFKLSENVQTVRKTIDSLIEPLEEVTQKMRTEKLLNKLAFWRFFFRGDLFMQSPIQSVNK